MDTVIVAFVEAMWSDPAMVSGIIGCYPEVLEHEQVLREYLHELGEDEALTVAEELAVAWRSKF